MSGSGEAAWITPITMTYLPANTAADAPLFSRGPMEDGRDGDGGRADSAEETEAS